jgi:hypothetical protein
MLMALHALFPASTSKRWSACPGSEVARRAAPEGGGQCEWRPGASEVGTAAHAVLEFALTRGLRGSDLFSLAGCSVQFGDGGEALRVLGALDEPDDERVVAITEEVLDGVSVAVEYVDERVAAGAVLLAVEARLVVLSDRDDCWGTVDVLLAGPGDLLEAVDYKNGAVHVNHVDNSQLLSYLLGASRAYPQYSAFRGTIVQPNSSGRPTRSCDYSALDLRRHEKLLAKSAREVDRLSHLGGDLAALDREGALLAGDHCDWCPMIATCPELKRRVQKVVGADFDEVPGPDWKSMAPVARVLAWAPVVRAFLQACERDAYAILSSGGSVPGYKLVAPSPGRRRYRGDITAQEVEDAYVAAGGQPANLFAPPAMRSVRELEDLLPRKRRAAFSEAVAERSPGKPRLVPVWEDGEPVAGVSPSDDFPDDF